jgi:hypothetical protein
MRTNYLFIIHVKKIYQFYEDVYENTPAMHAKLIVGNCNRRDAKNDLIRK